MSELDLVLNMQADRISPKCGRRPRRAETDDPAVYKAALEENGTVWRNAYDQAIQSGIPLQEAAHRARRALDKYRDEHPFPWLIVRPSPRSANVYTTVKPFELPIHGRLGSAGPRPEFAVTAVPTEDPAHLADGGPGGLVLDDDLEGIILGETYAAELQAIAGTGGLHHEENEPLPIAG